MKKALLYLFLSLPLSLFAQQNITMADAIAKGRTALAPANLRQLQWIPGTAQFSHVVNNKIVRVNADDLAVDTLNLLQKLNAAFASQTKPSLDGLPAITWLDANKVWFQNDKEVYTYSLTGGLKMENWYAAGVENLDIHPKTFAAAYTVGKRLQVNIGGKELGIAESEKEGIVYGKSVHRDEFGIFKGTFWSPSGRYLAFYRMDESMVTQYPIYVLDSMPAQVRYIRYPYAGATSHQVTVGVFDTQTGRKLYLQTGEPAEQYLTNIAWSPDDQYIFVAVVNREQNHMWLQQFDAQTGAYIKTLFEETNEKYVEPEQPARFVTGSNTQFIWQSERDGFNQLYLYDLSGKMIRQLTQGTRPVINFYSFSDNGEKCFYQVADESGMNRYVMATTLKTGATIRLNDDVGYHTGLVNGSGQWALDLFANQTTPRMVYVQPVQNAAARKVVFSAPNPLAGYNLGETRLVSFPSPGGPQLNARMILPTNFDPTKKYPVIVNVYNGPHVQMVANVWLGGGELWMHHLAEEGFIVFAVDGRGSANRGFAFESAIFRHVGDVEVQDQLAGVRYLKSQAFVDSTRFGVYGWSYGGFMTTSLMTRPEANGVFKCGLAGGPVLDWRMYEIMYGERYMDTPQENPDGYQKSSLFSYIDNLTGRLMIIHDSSDDTVLWQHSLRYIRECIRKGKQIDYFVYPEHPHNVQGRDRIHLFEKIDGFFKDNLQKDPNRP